jgi:hypothetical protein
MSGAGVRNLELPRSDEQKVFSASEKDLLAVCSTKPQVFYLSGSETNFTTTKTHVGKTQYTLHAWYILAMQAQNATELKLGNLSFCS